MYSEGHWFCAADHDMYPTEIHVEDIRVTKRKVT